MTRMWCSAFTAESLSSDEALEARIAQLVVCWARCPARCSIVGLTLLLASDGRDYSLGVSMGSDSIP